MLQSGNHTVDQHIKWASAVTGTATIIRICPLPVYLVYDRFDQDLDATMVYERVMEFQHDSFMRTNALAFLRTCMVGQWRAGDTKPYQPAAQFHRMLPMAAKLWGAKRMDQLLPELGITPVPVTPQPRARPPGL